MAEISHLFHISAPRSKVYEALSTVKGLSGWWTADTSGKSEPGGLLEFRFGPHFLNKMKVKELVTDKSVSWDCIESAPDWVGTKLTFHLDDNDGKTRVRFNHGNWNQANDFMAQCNFSWGRYMESLRNLCEKGKGSPFGA
jgi:uncharacterized protein YndB with AHSA1/START domain